MIVRHYFSSSHLHLGRLSRAHHLNSFPQQAERGSSESDNLSLETAAWSIKSITSRPSPANGKSLDTTLAQALEFYSARVPQD